MKKIFITIALIVSVASMFAQKADENDLKDLMKDLGYSWSETESVMLGEGESAYFWRTFFGGNEYAIVCFSENNNVFDIDLLLYDVGGSLIDKSISGANFEQIDFTPPDIKQVKVVVNNFECSEEQVVYKCKFMIFYK